MKTRWVLALAAAAAFAAACGGGTTATSAPGSPTVHPSGSTAPVSPVSSTPQACLTRDLKLHLGGGGAAAGSFYAPVVFTNTGSSTCTLLGYPGVSYVAPDTGRQVGAAASRNPQQSPSLVTLAPGGVASALLQMANPSNYPVDRCHPVTVSGLRVYPPGNTAAAYIAFPSTRTACSTDVGQLSVEAVVSGDTGQ